MAFSDIIKRAPGLFVLWIVAVIIIFVIVVLYIMMSPHMNKGGRTDIARSLANAISGLGIGLCALCAIWIILLVGLMRDAKNVWADASSIYVSRSNLLLNWFTDGSGPPISGIAGAPTDGTQCFKNFSPPNDPAAYDGYRALIKTYASGGDVQQYYEQASSTVPLGSANVPSYHDVDNIANQQKLSLAYYRYVYCAKAYFEDILNKKDIQQMTWLTPDTRNRLDKTPAESCIATQEHIPDTQACIDGGRPPNCARNPCFAALNETIAAQCLFTDDHVYKLLNPQKGPLGVLEAMQVTGFPLGYQVRAP
jgi:hypothetical protein